MSNTEYYKRALERASILWDHYDKHGKVLIADVKQLTGQPSRVVYISFETFDISAPPVWDSHREKIKRKATLLIDMVETLEQDHLTEQQAAKALNIKPSHLYIVLCQIHKHAIPIPEVIGHAYERYNNEEIKCEVPRIDEDYYPTGLPVLDDRPGPDGKTIYRIR